MCIIQTVVNKLSLKFFPEYLVENNFGFVINAMLTSKSVSECFFLYLRAEWNYASFSSDTEQDMTIQNACRKNCYNLFP